MSISDEHCLIIGKICVTVGNIESWVSSLVWALIGEDQLIGQMVTAEMSFLRQLDLLSSLFQHRFSDSESCQELKQQVKQLEDLSKERNRLLHSLWLRQSMDEDEATRLKITSKRKKGLVHSKDELKPEDLESIFSDFESALKDFSSFVVKYANKKVT